MTIPHSNSAGGEPGVDGRISPRRSVVTKVTLSVGLTLAVLIAALLAAGFHFGREVLRKQIDAHLSSVASSRHDMVQAHLSQLKQRAELLADHGEFRGLFHNLKTDQPDTTNRKFSQGRINNLIGHHTILSASLADDTGHVLLASAGTEAGGELAGDPAFEKGMDGPYVGPPRPVGDHFEVVLAAPIRDYATPPKNIAVLLMTADISSLASAVRDTTGLGETGEVVLGIREGDHVRTLFPPRFRKQTMVIPLVNVPAMVAALEGRNFLGMTRDYRGEQVLAAALPVGYGGWGLVTKMDADEAYAPIARAMRYGLLCGGIVAAAGLVAAWLLARGVARPVQRLVHAAARVAGGDYETEVPIKSADEFGVLAASFNEMTAAIRSHGAERDANEDALRGSEERLRLALEASGMGVCVGDLKPAGTVSFDGQACAIMGLDAASREWTMEEILEKLIHPDDRERIQTGLARMLEQGRGAVVEYRIIRPDGAVRWLQGAAIAQQDAAGTPVLFIAVSFDITERKRADEQIHRANRRLAFLSEASAGLLGADDPVVFLALIFQWLRGLLDVELCLHFASEDDCTLRLVLHHGVAEEATAGFRQLAFGQGVCGAAAAERRPFILENVQARSDEMTAIARGLGLDAYACLPLVAHGRLLGTLSFGSATRSRFEGEEIALFQSLADEVAMALARQHAEAALAAERTLLRTLIDLLPDAIYIKDRESRFLAANETLAHVMGAGSPQVVIGKTDADFYPAEQAGVFRADEERILAGETLTNREEPIVLPDGSRCVMLTTKVPLKDAGGNITGLVGIGRNITERKHAEEALLASEARLRQVMDLVPHFIFAKDSDGRFIFANRALAQACGMTPEELVGRRDSDLSPARAEVEHFRSDDREVIESGRPKFISEEPHTDASGRARILQTLKVPFALPGAEKPGVLGVAVDITELKKSEEEIRRLNASLEGRVRERTAQLEEANRELESFSYSVSHDLRAPLRAVNGYARMMLDKYGGQLDDDGRRLAGVICHEGLRMGRLIDALLAFSRLGRQAMSATAIDMTSLAREAFAEAAGEAKERKLDFRLGDLPPAHGDRTLLRQVFVNLFSNAVKFTGQREPAVIEAGARTENAETVYWVRDDGAGFDPRYADKLFGVFQRLHRQDEFEGTGVGLAFVQRIIQRHGGRIWADSQPGKGATFYFTLQRPEDHPHAQ